ncbi:hypothetical protein [Nesterenkonia flava]|uniref:LPXTG cell wall anchor domain-containing protein n=1 Tax=Nesterenkonia flava TaxID=469799 RepID=A0ABU1FU40_9MICC|nr:hypothetical protein [Nesterenkonia flava]MDR5712169.1 hypothetical protein [Nesterenkonia flava]
MITTEETAVQVWSADAGEFGENVTIAYIPAGAAVVVANASAGLESYNLNDGLILEQLELASSPLRISGDTVVPAADGEQSDELPSQPAVPDLGDLPVITFPARDASNYQDEVVLVVTEDAPVYADSARTEPLAYVAAGSIIRISSDLENVGRSGQSVGLRDHVFARALDGVGRNDFVYILSDHITTVDDDTAVSEGDRPEVPESDAPTVQLATPEYQNDPWNFLVTTQRTPVYGSFTEGIQDEIVAYVPAGTLVRYANNPEPGDEDLTITPDSIGELLLIHSDELDAALEQTDFSIFYFPTDYIRNANDDDLEIFYDDDEDDDVVTPPSDDEDEDQGGSGDDSAGDDDESQDPGTVELTVEPGQVAPGVETSLYAEGFEAEEDVTVQLNPELGTFPADENGAFTAVVTIPEDTEPGEHTITVTGAESGLTGSATITVVAPVAPAGAVTGEDPLAGKGGTVPAPVAAGGLAQTGVETSTAVGSGLLLLLGGALAALGYKNRLGRRGSDA